MSFESVPTRPAATLWEGELVPRPDAEPDGARKGLFRSRLDPAELNGARPVVTIGTPEVLRAVKPQETPGFAPMVATDVYLVRLWCSFLDPDGDLRFERGHFALRLSSSDPHAPIVARDMHPTQVLHKVKRDVSVGLTPEVTFAEVGVQLGSFSYGFAYDELQPAISAAGQGEATPTWTFASTKSLRLQGGKAMHLLVAAPEGTPAGEAELELRAYVTKPGRLPLLFERHGAVPAEPLKVRLW